MLRYCATWVLWPRTRACCESMLKRVAKYLRKLVAEKKDDPTFMPEEDFFQMIDEAKKGPSKRFESVEDLDKYIRSL